MNRILVALAALAPAAALEQTTLAGLWHVDGKATAARNAATMFAGGQMSPADMARVEQDLAESLGRMRATFGPNTLAMVQDDEGGHPMLADLKDFTSTGALTAACIVAPRDDGHGHGVQPPQACALTVTENGALHLAIPGENMTLILVRPPAATPAP